MKFDTDSFLHTLKEKNSTTYLPKQVRLFTEMSARTYYNKYTYLLSRVRRTKILNSAVGVQTLLWF